jgi:hypothetical protein
MTHADRGGPAIDTQDSAMSRTRRRAFRPALDRLDDRCLLSGLTPAQVTHAYGVDSITFRSGAQTVKGDGTAQTIAIVVAFHDPYVVSDLHTFDQTYNLPDPVVSQVDQSGGKTDDGWAGEEMLDVEWSHAMAPGARIMVVEARTDNDSDMVAAVDYARKQPGVAVVSMSWGDVEAADEASLDGTFTTPADHNGVTFVAASGDDGGASGPGWPASSPNVVSVGGTTLRVDAAGNNLGESLWAGSGRGTSLFEPVPGYQQGVQSGSGKNSPDVTLVADPSTGAAMYASQPSNGQASWHVVGGTSLSTPAFAGVLAIVDQGRAINGKGTLDGPTQTLPALYRVPATDFLPVGLGGQPGGQSGYNPAAGLGSPNGPVLVSDLVLDAHQTGGGAGGGGGGTGGGGGGTGGATGGFGGPGHIVTGQPIYNPIGGLPGSGSSNGGGQVAPPAGTPAQGGGTYTEGAGGGAGGPVDLGSTPAGTPTLAGPYAWVPVLPGGYGVTTTAAPKPGSRKRGRHHPAAHGHGHRAPHASQAAPQPKLALPGQRTLPGA